MEHDPLDIKAQALIEAEKKQMGKLKTAQEDSDIRWLMSSKRGRRIVSRLLETAGVNRSSFSDKALVMAFREGHRNYGNVILQQIVAVCFEMYLQMLKEHQNVRKPARKSKR